MKSFTKKTQWLNYLSFSAFWSSESGFFLDDAYLNVESLYLMASATICSRKTKDKNIIAVIYYSVSELAIQVYDHKLKVVVLFDRGHSIFDFYWHL